MAKGKSSNPSEPCLSFHKMRALVLTYVQTGEIAILSSASALPCLQSISVLAEHLTEAISCEP